MSPWISLTSYVLHPPAVECFVQMARTGSLLMRISLELLQALKLQVHRSCKCPAVLAPSFLGL